MYDYIDRNNAMSGLLFDLCGNVLDFKPSNAMIFYSFLSSISVGFIHVRKTILQLFVRSLVCG